MASSILDLNIKMTMTFEGSLYFENISVCQHRKECSWIKELFFFKKMLVNACPFMGPLIVVLDF